MRLHHIGIVVESISAAMDLYKHLLGFKTDEKIFQDKNQKVNVLFVSVGEVKVEFIEPISEDSPVSNFLKKNNGGIHHLAFEVEDVKKETDKLREKGVPVVCEPVHGFEGRYVSFFHPKSFKNVLIEFVERK